MPKYFSLSQPDRKDILGSLNAFVTSLLEGDVVDVLLAPQHLPHGNMVQHVLLKDPAFVTSVDPLAPVLPVNGAILAARLTRQDPGGKIGALLRPCEIRAFVELVKLHQGDRKRLLLIGIDCLGTFEPTTYMEWAKDQSDGSLVFLDAMLDQEKSGQTALMLRRCCQACEFPTPEGADIQILLLGTDGLSPCLTSGTSDGEACLQALELSEIQRPAQRDSAVASLVQNRTSSRDALFQQVESELLPLDRLLGELSACINCYNCRDACPVCYCKGCVFEGQTFEHPAAQYLRWARRKGAIKMPTDTLFFHVTRLAHMSTSCVGCGQCSSACPMGIRVADIFRTVAKRTQAIFEYVPGRDLEEPLPLATFREEELTPR
jgi:formate dehydrogenase subunit beta